MCLPVAILVGLAAFAAILDVRSLPARGPRNLEGARRGLAFGVGANVVALRFIPATVSRFAHLPLVVGLLLGTLLVAAQALPWLACAVADRWLVRLEVPRPAAFALGVYAATMTPALFPWTPAGGLSSWPRLIQPAELFGERGVSSFVAAVAATCVVALRRFRGGDARAGAGLLAAAMIGVGLDVGFGMARVSTIDALHAAAPRARIALLQPAIEPALRSTPEGAARALAELSALAREAEARSPDLTIWPEGSYPYALPHGARGGPSGAQAILPPEVRTPALVGLAMEAETAKGAYYNSAVIAFPGGALSDSYDKRRPLVFGESAPFASSGWMQALLGRAVGVLPGGRIRALSSGTIRAGVLICYEDTLPESGRDAMSARPNLLVNITNDGWFEGSAEPELHLRMSVFRAIEARRDLVRAVNLGPPSWIDASGMLRAEDASVRGVFSVEPALLAGPLTLYSAVGDLPGVFLGVVVVASAFLRRSRGAGQGIPTALHR